MVSTIKTNTHPLREITHTEQNRKNNSEMVGSESRQTRFC